MIAPKTDNQPSLAQWAQQAIGLDAVRVKVRSRGNDLHVLCEGQECPEETLTLNRLVLALQSTNLDALTPTTQPQIYQLFLYGRAVGQKLPTWRQRIYLNQLERHLEVTPLESTESVLDAGATSSQPSATGTMTARAMIVSNQSLAQQGDPDAIARYLSETLSTLGVGVKVKVKRQVSDKRDQDEVSLHPASSRLWVSCESAYSPDASLLAEPISQQLRDLKLQGFRDAVIVSQVSGEKTADWMLRVDLTPPEEMLREWAHWGDVQAIARLLNQALFAFNIEVRAVLKDSTLHLFCNQMGGRRSPSGPDRQCLEAIAPLLETLAPQGIHAATVYGQQGQTRQGQTGQGQIQAQSPAWVDWLDLPGGIYPALREPALALAAAGDEPAITFLLSRLLNLDLDWRLATGGIRVVVRRKADLLHVMSDAPICPPQNQVGPPVAKFLRSLKIPGIAGVRVYGRRAGQKQPFWSYGIDFTPRQRLVPEPTPEFAASHAYIGELLTQSAQQFRPDLTPDRAKSSLTRVLRRWGTALRVFLLRSQLFCENVETLPGTPPSSQATERIKAALIWATLGLVITVEADWLMGQILTRHSLLTSAASRSEPPILARRAPVSPSKFQHSQPQTDEPSTFNASGFTQSAENGSDIHSGDIAAQLVTPPKQRANATAILLAARSHLPSFNSRLLDQQLALYQQHLSETGPPDVLIIGSSRALRGVDPAALSKALAAQGHPNVKVFNFGINGATAQVVDLLIRQILTPAQLPKLVLWADGARAFNSGRVDITYNGIAASAGYKQLIEERTTSSMIRPALALTSRSGVLLPTPASDSDSQEAKMGGPIATSYQAIGQWLNQALAKFSASYSKRDQLKELFVQQLQSLPFTSDRSLATKKFSTSSGEDVNFDAVEFDGFLPLSIHFNPATYYQKHPKVSGDYDSDYESFELGGTQEAAMQALLQFTQSRHVPLVFVNLPLTQAYLDSARTEYEQAFQQYMLRLATRRGFIYRDLSQLWPAQNDYFSDPSHLNRYGAYEVSNRLAQDPMVPWPSK